MLLHKKARSKTARKQEGKRLAHSCMRVCCLCVAPPSQRSHRDADPSAMGGVGEAGTEGEKEGEGLSLPHPSEPFKFVNTFTY